MIRYFISDLHLDMKRLDVAKAFQQFLQKEAPNADELYILGDFFEAWIGDDYSNPFVDLVKQALKALTDSGTKLFFMHGNRDFLLGEEFCKQTGSTLLVDPSIIDLDGTPVLLMHGDSLCTQDEAYMQFRNQVRTPDWCKMVLSKSIPERIQMAVEARTESQATNQMKSDEIMDVTPEEVVKLMEQQQVNLMIHGHTHRPMIHDLDLKTGNAKRYVLGDWDKQGWVIKAEGQSLSLESFDI